VKNFLKYVLTAGVLFIAAAPALSFAQVWVLPIRGGEMRFDDWGYVGPSGRGALDFAPINGFGGPAEGNSVDPSGGVGQMQTVVTLDPDWLTPDPPYTVYGDLISYPTYSNANMDGTVNFAKWAYTTVAGSTFNNMQIDYDGDYLVKRSDMQFVMYDVYRYKDMTLTNPDLTYDTYINFQPYALSDATGWCGSVLASHPLAAESMAGQVKFDVGFMVFLPSSPTIGVLQIIPDFAMRSYGSLEVYSTYNVNFPFMANAVVNNTDPALARDATHPMGFVNPAFYNRVSFMGGGSIPGGAWLYPGATGPTDVRVHPVQGTPGASNGEVRADGAVWYSNTFIGYPFLLRADGRRNVTFFDVNRYGPDPMSPVAKAVNVKAVTGQTVNWQPAVSAPNGNPLSCRIGTPPQNGATTVASNCSSGTYQSNPGFVGVDSFTYISNDGRLDSLPGTVTVAVTEPLPSDPCLASYPVSQFSQVGKGGTLTIAFTGNVVSHTAKGVKVCPGTTLSYKTASTMGAVVCKVKNNFTRGTGSLRINDHIKCTDKPAGTDKVYFKVKSGIS
jgi:hypothetical protein